MTAMGIRLCLPGFAPGIVKIKATENMWGTHRMCVLGSKHGETNGKFLGETAKVRLEEPCPNPHTHSLCCLPCRSSLSLRTP